MNSDSIGNRVCPKFKGICQDESGMRFCSCFGNPDRCSDSSCKSITIVEWLREYLEYQKNYGRCRKDTIKNRISHLKVFLHHTGLTENDPVSMIGKETFNLFWSRASSLKSVTRKSILTDLYNMNSDDFREYLLKKGLSLEKIPRVKGFTGGYDRYVPISEASRKALGDLRFRYRNLEDPRKWMALTLGLCHGLSKADVLRSTWDIFKEVNGKTIISYNRNKTGKTAEWVISDDDLREWNRVRKIMMYTKKFCARFNLKGTENSLFRLKNTDPNTVLTSEIIDEINKDLRETIREWRNDSKAFHNLRKEFANFVCWTYDWDTAELATGDTSATLRKSYVGKKVIDWNRMSGMTL